MTRINYLTVLLFVTVFTACGSKDDKTTPDVPSTNTTVPPATLQPLPANSSASTVSAGLNPAHGQPGHRCDIAVGAPLNSPPAQVAPAPVAPSNMTTPQKGVIAPVPTMNNIPAGGVSASGLNPAHGQPGHRCDIPVGAPLNSKPSK